MSINSANAAVSLLTNGGFDAQDASGGDIFGSSGWIDFGGGTFTTDSAASGGAASPDALSPNNSFKVFSTSGAYQEFTATAGDVFAGSGFGQNFSGDPLLNLSTLRLQIAYVDEFGNPAGTAAGGNLALGFNLFDSNTIDASSPQNEWIEMGVGTAPAPDNTAAVRFIALGLNGSGGAGFFDSTSFSQAVPEPGSLAALCVGGVAVIARRRRRS